MNKQKYFLNVALVILLPLLGATLMYGIIYLFPMSQESSTGRYIAYSIVITCLGLAIPYWMLKSFATAAHQWDFREKELHLKDLPKDKEQLEEKMQRR